MSEPLEALYSTPAMSAAFSARAHVRNMLLFEAALADEVVRASLSPPQIERALDPGLYLGSADAFIDRALAAYRAVASQ